MQILLCTLVLLEVMSSPPEEGVWQMLPTDTWIIMSRFICGIVLHVFLQGELTIAVNNMKFAVNHPWKFDNYFLAWLAGFLQATMVIYVESVNYIALLTNLSHLDIVMNFMALVVIADFDDFFYSALLESPYKEVITNSDKTYDEFLLLQMTTSYIARNPVRGDRVERQDCEKVHEKTLFKPENPKDETHNYHDFLPKHVYVDFWRRKWHNKLLYLIYTLFRLIIVSVWYYFVPFVALLANFVVPALLINASEAPEADPDAAPAPTHSTE